MLAGLLEFLFLKSLSKSLGTDLRGVGTDSRVPWVGPDVGPARTSGLQRPE